MNLIYPPKQTQFGKFRKNPCTPLKHLIKNYTQVTNIKDVANTLAEKSPSTMSNTEFHKYKDKKEKNV